MYERIIFFFRTLTLAILSAIILVIMTYIAVQTAATFYYTTARKNIILKETRVVSKHTLNRRKANVEDEMLLLN